MNNAMALQRRCCCASVLRSMIVARRAVSHAPGDPADPKNHPTGSIIRGYKLLPRYKLEHPRRWLEEMTPPRRPPTLRERASAAAGGGGGGGIDVDKEMGAIGSKFTEALELLNEARSSMGTVYFSEDMKDAEQLIEETLADYAALLAKLEDTQKTKVRNAIGLKMEELQVQLKMLKDSLKIE